MEPSLAQYGLTRNIRGLAQPDGLVGAFYRQGYLRSDGGEFVILRHDHSSTLEPGLRTSYL